MPDNFPTLYKQPGSRWWYYSLYSAEGRERLSCRRLGLSIDVPEERALAILMDFLGMGPKPPENGQETIGWFKEETLHRLDRERCKESTIKEYRIALNHLILIFGSDFLLRKFRRSDIGRLQDALLRHDKPPTVNKICRHLRGAFSRLVDDEILERNPFRKFRVIQESDHKKNLTREEAVLFLNAVAAWPDESIRRLIRIYLFTGRRLREILNLPSTAIDMNNWTLRVPNNKARHLEWQVIRIDPAIRRSVSWFCAEPRRSRSKPDYPVSNCSALDYPFCVCKKDYLYRQVKNILISSNLGTYDIDIDDGETLTRSILRLHSLRHTFGTLARESGVSREDLQAHFGHANIETTELYDHFTPLPEISLGLDYNEDNDI